MPTNVFARLDHLHLPTQHTQNMAVNLADGVQGSEALPRARWYVHSCKKLRRLTSYRKYLDNFLTRIGPFTDPDAFEPGDAAIAGLERMKIL
jgi:ubiquitin-activating enzyme E1 C